MVNLIEREGLVGLFLVQKLFFLSRFATNAVLVCFETEFVCCYHFCYNFTCGGGQWAGGVWKTVEERAGSSFSMRAGSGREIQKGKRSLCLKVLLIIQSKTQTQKCFFDFHLTYPGLQTKF